MTEKNYNFGEKNKEKVKQQDSTWKDLDVWQSPKYLKSRQKATELIENGGYELEEGDFWILMNQGGGKMVYTGLIISHNGCLKINDKLEEKLKFKPLSVSFVRDTGEKEKTMAYINQEQGVYEFGEISTKNCKNDYPYAMVLKRLMDRVILKNSKIGFFGIYSEAESDAFKDKNEEKEGEKKPAVNKNAHGLDPNGELANGTDMKDMLKQSNDDTVVRLIAAIKKQKDLKDLEEWLANPAVKKEMNKLEKYSKGGFDSVNVALKEFRFMNQDDSGKLNEIGN